MRVVAKHSIEGFVKGAAYRARSQPFGRLNVYVGGEWVKTKARYFSKISTREI